MTGHRAAAAATVVLISLTAGVVRAGVAGRGMRKRVRAQRVKTAPVIDGKLDEAVWQEVAGDDRFTQQFPRDGAEPTRRTELRLLYDDTALYIGVTALDAEPNRIVARTARRDNRVDSDSITVVLDTRHDHDSGYFFWINAAGVLADGQMHDDNRLNDSWNGVWYGKAKITARGWTAELKIPYSILRFAKRGKQQWGINVTRYVSRDKETLQWVHVPQNERGVLSRAGHITGIAGIEPPRRFELRPFLLTRLATLLPRGGALGIGQSRSSDADIAAGVDLKYGLTPNLTLDATVLPDFGQVEADPVFLNLSTFEVFLPERRPFFVENADLFVTDVQMFYSRRIGERLSGLSAGSATRARDGEAAEVVDTPLAVPIWTAARVTGKLSRKLTIAAIDAVTGPESLDIRTESGADKTIDPVPIRNYAAVRGKYSFGGSSYLGFMATGHTRSDEVDNPVRNHDAYAESIDGRWVAKDGMYRLYFHVVGSHRVGGPSYYETTGPGFAPCTPSTCTHLARADGTLQRPGDRGSGGEMGGGKVGGNWTAWFNYGFRSPRFDINDVGFDNNWDYHRGYVDLGWRRQKRFGVLQNANINLRSTLQWGFDGVRRDGNAQLVGGLLFTNFWSTNVSLLRVVPNRFTRRETSDGARYEQPGWLQGSWSFGTDSRRQIIGGGYVTASTATSDPAWGVSMGANLRLRTAEQLQLTLDAGYNISHGDLRFFSCTARDGRPCSVMSSERDYVFTRLDSGSLSLTSRGTWAMSTRMSLEAYAQLFAGRAGYRDGRLLAGVRGAKPFLRRADILASPADDALVAGADFSFDSLNVNLLWRWEFKPGNTLIAVYTRATSADRNRSLLTFRGLGNSRTEEVGLLKLSLVFQ